jgi:deoxycytidylate deaminase
MAANPETGVVNIRGRDYHTVANRISRFRKSHPDYSIETQLISQDDEKVIMKSLIMDGERLIATGYAEEVRASSNINQTSALENAETSAVGRALAFFGLAGTEIASADEVAGAISQQNEKVLYERFAATTKANEENHDSLVAIREFLAEENFDAAREAWNEVDHDDQKAIWVATTKGGWFTTRERQQMKYWSNEFETTRK